MCIVFRTMTIILIISKTIKKTAILNSRKYFELIKLKGRLESF